MCHLVSRIIFSSYLYGPRFKMTGQFKMLTFCPAPCKILWHKFAVVEVCQACSSMRHCKMCDFHCFARTCYDTNTFLHKPAQRKMRKFSRSCWGFFCFIGVFLIQFCWAWPELKQVVKGFVQMAPAADRLETLTSTLGSLFQCLTTLW